MNVGKAYTKDGRYFDTGVPKGFSDLFGFRKSDGKAVFIEVKTPTGKPSEKQQKYLSAVRNARAIAGKSRRDEEAEKNNQVGENSS